jgi:hypothetical protein
MLRELWVLRVLQELPEQTASPVPLAYWELPAYLALPAYQPKPEQLAIRLRIWHKP